jgi:hypothetical protein
VLVTTQSQGGFAAVAGRPSQRFACVSDIDEYRDLLRDPSYAVLNNFIPIRSLDGASEHAFQLVEVLVDGAPRKSQRTERGGAQFYTVSLGGEVEADDRMVAIAYCYRTLVRQHRHLFHLDLTRPTKGVLVHFAYGGCAIDRVNVLDYIASAAPVGLSRLPASEPTPSIALRFDG